MKKDTAMKVLKGMGISVLSIVGILFLLTVAFAIAMGDGDFSDVDYNDYYDY